MIGAPENFRFSPQPLRSKSVPINVNIGIRRRIRSDIRQSPIFRFHACVVGDEMASVPYTRVPRCQHCVGEFMNSRVATSFVALNNPCRFGRVAV